jgi:serine/threonine protein phosphatase 1
MGRVLAIGDIHGCSRALHALLALVQPRPEDLVITLGDMVDRGPDSAGVIQHLLTLQKSVPLVALRGNHEQMMLAAREGEKQEKNWLACGGRQTLASYSVLGAEGKLVDVPDHHWEFLEHSLVDWHETATHFFVHANAYPDMPLAEQPEYMLLWEEFDRPAPHESGKVMVCGHTPQKDGRPRNLGHAVCIDTWAHGRGWLTCLDVTTGQVWQAGEPGARRVGWLDDMDT